MNSKKILYIDCGMGAAGDMLTASLLEAAFAADESSAQPGSRVDRKRVEEFVKKFHEAGIPGVEMQIVDGEKNGITGTHVKILVHGIEEGTPGEMQTWDHEHGHHHYHHDDEDHEHEHHHHHDHEHGHVHAHVHRSMQDIEAIVAGLQVPEEVKADVRSVYKAIAEAEGKVHGKPAGEVHFHEVGTLDAVADITAVCMLIREIDPDEIVASPIATGYGTVRCAHGVLPVPAPATALLLKNIPSYAGRVNGELCTPTGAALVGHFADRFGQMPAMRTSAIGYGIGMKDFEEANCLRVFLGEAAENAGPRSEARAEDLTPKTVTELSCNIDDMTGEEIGFASERLFAEGALDVYVVPIYMKKNRPGILIRVMCRTEDREKMVKAIFRYTSTIGIRESVMNRYVLHRTTEEIRTGDLTISKKNVEGYGTARSKYEYEDLAELARQKKCSLRKAGELADGHQE